MGDTEYLCDLYGIDPSESHKLVDIILEGDEKDIKAEQDALSLEPGRMVHLIWLTSASPAQVVKVELNTRLKERLCFQGFNQLSDVDFNDPASWFLRKGFTVRSTKVNGRWLQCAFASSGPTNLTRSEIIEYLRDVAKLAFDEYKVNDHSAPTVLD